MRAEKWRPSLGLVVLGVLAIVAMLPLFGLFLTPVFYVALRKLVGRRSAAAPVRTSLEMSHA